MRIAVDNVIFQMQKDRPGGISRVWFNLIPLIKTLLEDENEIVLFSREGSLEEDFGLKVYSIPQYGKFSLDVDDKILSDACKKLEVDLFLSTYCTRALGVKNLVVVYDLIPEKVFGIDALHSGDFAGRQRSYATADMLVCISESTKRELCTRYNKIFDKVEVAHLGVSKEFCPKTLAEITSFRKRYNVLLEYIILDGGIAKKIVEPFCQVFASLSSLSFLTYGLPLKKDIIENCTKYGIPLRQLPWLENRDIPVALSGSKGLVFLPPHEGFGLPVLEAMACGTPVFCSNVDSLPEVGGDSVQYLTNHMKDSLSSFLDTENRKQLVEKGLIRSKLFTWEKMAEKIVQMIKRESRI